MKRLINIAIGLVLLFPAIPTIATETFVTFSKENNTILLAGTKVIPTIIIDSNTDAGIKHAVTNLQHDLQKVTDILPVLQNTRHPERSEGSPGQSQSERPLTMFGMTSPAIIIGTFGESELINQLAEQGKLNVSTLAGKREMYIIQTVDDNLVIAGSDKRGTIYGIYELSQQIGVSPWYYWADVPIRKQESIYIIKGSYTDGEPAVKYRGIFLNDEAPALSGWARQTFGGFNHKFYEKVFELILRLKGNFLWPAMWGNAFYDDDPQNGVLANEMGIVISTSHHEPMGRAHAEWKRYGSGAWDYNKNPKVLQEFWKGGMQRMKNWEAVVSIGMRGDGDEAMSEGTNIALLEKIVRDQRKIISSITGKKSSETPQVWALYKEVQDYYDKGMRVPDDVTLLLCDDNWGNVRKLPRQDAAPRRGGYGMYYHFDYVGGPRNYKWLNVSQVQRIWEQMNLTYRYGVKELWVVNVGDLKPMEYPIQFFLDMAWNPDRFNENNLLQHTETFCAQQFGKEYAQEAARLINMYTKFNRRVTPELLNARTYSLHNYNEFERVTNDYKALLLDAMKLYYLIPEDTRDAYDQLVLFPIHACANLYEMYYAVAMNHDLAEKNNPEANAWADKVKEHFVRDSLLTVHYHTQIAGGKWNHMMSQTHIGYTSWQQPDRNIMPEVRLVPETKIAPLSPVFIENNGYISIEAENYTRTSNGEKTRWIVIPHLGKTLSAVTTTPVTIRPEEETWLEYDMELATTGEVNVEILVSPTLNFNDNRGLRYAVSFDGKDEQIVNFNGHYRGELGQWQGESIIKTSTKHIISTLGKHTLRFRALDPGIVLQKIMIDTGGLKPSYLGAPQSTVRR